MNTKIDDQTYDRFLTHFEKQLERVDKWLTFAEAKNVALIAFNISVAGAFVSNNGSLCLLILSAVFLLCILVSTLIALLSFFPIFVTSKEDVGKESKNVGQVQEENSDGNMIFYVHIAKLPSSEAYLRKTVCSYFPDVKQEELDVIANDGMLKDFADEIFENSIISVRKYNMFKRALFFSLISVISYFIIIMSSLFAVSMCSMSN